MARRGGKSEQATKTSPTRRRSKKTAPKTAAPTVEDGPEGEFPESDVVDEAIVVDVGAEDESAAPTRAVAVRGAKSSVPAVRGRAAGTALDRFLAEVGKYPVLTPEEEKTLTHAVYEHGDRTAARRLVVHNLRLVVKMAYKYKRTWASVLDLVQEGNVGLIEAVQRFDPFKGARFSTYAAFWIRAYMLRYLLEHSRMVRIARTRTGRKLFFRLTKERERLRALGIDPGPKLLAERLNVDQSELEEVARYMDQSEVRLDAPLGTGDDGSTSTILDGMAHEGTSPEAEAYRREFEHDVSTALEAFAATLTDEREKDAWSDHLMSEDPVSLSELGARFGVTKQRMGQIVSGLRKRLKAHLIETLGPDVELGFQWDGD